MTALGSSVSPLDCGSVSSRRSEILLLEQRSWLRPSSPFDTDEEELSGFASPVVAVSCSDFRCDGRPIFKDLKRRADFSILWDDRLSDGND